MEKIPSIIVVLIAMLTACGENTDKERTISVSILPQRYFVERIAGDYVKVNVMIPPGANPAVSDLSTEQLKALHNSSIYFAVGYLPFELSNLYPFLGTQKNMLLVKQSVGMDLEQGTCNHDHGHGHQHDHGSHEGNFDPHVWMSPRYAEMMARTILDVLAAKFPDQRETFEKNYRQLRVEIDSIDQAARRIISEKEHKTFLIYHPALTYFAKDTCRVKGIKIVFIQNQFDVANAKAVAKEIDGEVITIDPLSPDWKAEMCSLLGIIEQKMK